MCNRQPWNVRFFRGEDALRALGHQNGNAGFGPDVPVVALVTTDLRLFAHTSERNQAWIEGGLFAMTLVWALHSLGVDSCMLNLSRRSTELDDMRNDLNVDEAEVPIMMIAVGYGRPGHRRARSPRRASTEVRRP